MTSRCDPFELHEFLDDVKLIWLVLSPKSVIFRGKETLPRNELLTNFRQYVGGGIVQRNIPRCLLARWLDQTRGESVNTAYDVFQKPRST
jgi:hypothetical protein